MPARCSPPRSSTSASTPCARPRISWRAPACRCGSTREPVRPEPTGLSLPGLSRQSRLTWHGRAKPNGMAGTSPAMTGREGADMSHPQKLDQPEEYWDRLFAPSSCLAMITTVDAEGRVNAAAFGTCVRVNHAPVCIAFTCNVESDIALGHTAANVLATGEFVVNLPAFDRASLEKVRVVGLPFARGVDEMTRAGRTAIPT